MTDDDNRAYIESMYAQEADRALRGHRADALGLWREVAAGNFHPNVQVWLTEVAEKVLGADAKTAKERPSAVLRAVGLSGVIDKHLAVREAAQTWRSFENLDGGRGPTLDQMAAELGVDPETLKNEMRKG